MLGRRRLMAPVSYQTNGLHAVNTHPQLQTRQMGHQQLYPYAGMGGNVNPYMQTNQFNTQMPYMHQYPHMQNMPYGQQQSFQAQYGQNNAMSQSIFHNPLDQGEEYTHQQAQQPLNPYPNMNPYPKQSFVAKQPSGVQSIMNSFKGQDGSLDFNKMMDTAGQMMNAVNQVSSMVKGVGGIFKV